MTCDTASQALKFLDSRPDKQRQALFDSIFNNQSALVITDTKGIVLKVNYAFCDMCGYTASELVGQSPRLLRSGRHDKSFYQAMFQKLEREGQWSGEVWDRHKSGRLFLKWSRITAIKDDNDHITHYVASYVDITAQRQARDEIHQLAFYDQLTSLPNRSMMLEMTERLQTKTKHTSQWAGLILMDLDNFKLINDQHGFSEGDLYLRDIALALHKMIPPEHTLSRLDGDQFVILQPATHNSSSHCQQAAESLLQNISQQFQAGILVRGEKMRLTACSGITLFNDSTQLPAELLRQAELALHQAKSMGRNKNSLYQPDMEHSANRRAKLQTALETALENREYHLVLQPQVDRDGRLLGAEALIRWHHPKEGPISPDEFISLAEKSGHIFEIGCWVLEESCRLLQHWQRFDTVQGITLSINVSALQFTHPGFVQQIMDCLSRYNIPPTQLKLELTESLLVEDSQNIAEKMQTLKASGIGLALDDFGTGYSSLSYLRNMSFDQLKIDRSFVCDLPNCLNAATITRTIATLGHSLGMSLVAEGVECPEQIRFLEELGCSIFQGYFYSRPLPADEFEDRYLQNPQPIKPKVPLPLPA